MGKKDKKFKGRWANDKASSSAGIQMAAHINEELIHTENDPQVGMFIEGFSEANLNAPSSNIDADDANELHGSNSYKTDISQVTEEKRVNCSPNDVMDVDDAAFLQFSMEGVVKGSNEFTFQGRKDDNDHVVVSPAPGEQVTEKNEMNWQSYKKQFCLFSPIGIFPPITDADGVKNSKPGEKIMLKT